jgi:Domain of unknown function (DUF4390)
MSSGEQWSAPRVRCALGLILLAAVTGVGSAAAQDSAVVRLEVALAQPSRDPVVFTRNLLEETPWLTALREGLPVRLQYRLEVWRSRQAWLDDVQRQLEWTVVVRHEPLLDQFTVTRIGPANNGITQARYATPAALAAALGVGYRFPIAPREQGRYYYTASLAVATLSDSDLEKLDRILKGELDPTNGEGGSLAERARRLILRLAGLPTLSLSASSDQFEVAP